MKVHYLPLEHVDARYTKAMDSQLTAAFRRRGIDVARYYPDGIPSGGEVPRGHFLDPTGTTWFKAQQIALLAAAFRSGAVNDGDAVFVSDLWFPGLAAVPYMAMFHDIDVRLFGVAHAGSWTPSDDVAKIADDVWNIERGWFDMADTVFVGSDFHRREILASPGFDGFDGRIEVTGLSFDSGDVIAQGNPRPFEERADRVVFAGRIHWEKQPTLFADLERMFDGTDVEFVRTFDHDMSKFEYYRLLGGSKVMVSFALQENFGYACLEAATLGCAPVVPDRVAYREMYPTGHRYVSCDVPVHGMSTAEHDEELAAVFARVMYYLTTPPKYGELLDIARRFDGSVDRMIDIMEERCSS